MASNLASAATADSKGLHPMDNPIPPQASVKDVPLPTGLTSDEARRRLEKFGPNAVPDTALHPLRRALAKFWAPVPWMLEAAIVLELFLGKYVEAANHRGSPGLQRGSGVLPGRARPGDSCRAEVAAGAERVGASR